MQNGKFPVCFDANGWEMSKCCTIPFQLQDPEGLDNREADWLPLVCYVLETLAGHLSAKVAKHIQLHSKQQQQIMECILCNDKYLLARILL